MTKLIIHYEHTHTHTHKLTTLVVLDLGVKVAAMMKMDLPKCLLLLLAVPLFCSTQVSSDLQNGDEMRGGSRLPQELVFLDTTGIPMNRYYHFSAAAAVPGTAPVPPPGGLDCKGLCGHRCSLHSRPNVCVRACGTCCQRCHCVPPGTFGNRELCGRCYTDMTTHRNQTKCP